MAGGRPKRQFSEEEEQKIKEYALCNCLTNTIAVALNIPLMTLKRRYGKKLKHWRAQYKVDLRQNQQALSKTSADMCKFLGKNYIGQTDKQTIQSETSAKQLSEAEVRAFRDAARQYNLKLARKGHQEAV